MTVTFPHPHIRRPEFKRYVVAGVAILATAVTFAGVRAAVSNDPATSAPTSAEVSATTVDASSIADFGGQADWMSAGPDSLSVTATVPDSAPNYIIDDDRVYPDPNALGVTATVPDSAPNYIIDDDRVYPDAGSFGAVPAPQSDGNVATGPYVDLSPVATLLSPSNSFSEADWTFADAGSLGVVPQG